MKSNVTPNLKDFMFKNTEILLKNRVIISGILIGYDSYSNLTVKNEENHDSRSTA
ncbi:hypothetical protein H312_03394 [Anncaliia algerae PRA339]|uniref:Sm domain-containing protein n=1 Tax=Anncaliia algerae PRA339 TaxID=1288291 RepID=A0A059EWC8_9MICR|nr:hypothetical protein H312_03394 [Anncaliia algerae PRA339]